MWTTNVLNLALQPQRHSPDAWLEHQEPVIHTAQSKWEKKRKKGRKREREREGGRGEREKEKERKKKDKINKRKLLNKK